jgi:hypothetical protein
MYGDGPVQGMQAYDTLILDSDNHIPKFPFGLVTDETGFNSNYYEMDGVCGLGFAGLATVSNPPLVDFLLLSGMDPVFAFFLNSDSGDEKHPSHVSFGSYDISIVSPTAKLHWFSISSVGMFWSLSIEAFELQHDTRGNIFNPYVCSGGCRAIVDSGTSGIGVPAQYYDALLHTISTSRPFPNIVIKIGDMSFSLLPSDYLVCNIFECSAMIQSTGDLWILGDTFMAAYYTVFDVKENRVGFTCSTDRCSGGSWQREVGNDHRVAAMNMIAAAPENGGPLINSGSLVSLNFVVSCAATLMLVLVYGVFSMSERGKNRAEMPHDSPEETIPLIIDDADCYLVR